MVTVVIASMQNSQPGAGSRIIAVGGSQKPLMSFDSFALEEQRTADFSVYGHILPAYFTWL